MAMFDDPKKELEKLEKQLLKEEDWFERELAEAKVMIGEEPAPKKKKKTQRPMEETQVYRTAGNQKSKTTRSAGNTSGTKKVRNFEDYDVNLDAYSEDVYAPQKSNRGLVILAVLETLGIVGVVAYWLLFLL